MIKVNVCVVSIALLTGCNLGHKSNDSTAPIINYGVPDFAVLNNTGTDYVPRIYPDVVYEGSLVEISIPYKNIGNIYQGTALNFSEIFNGTVNINDGDVPNAITGQSPIVIYDPSETKWYSTQVIVGAAGSYTFRFIIDDKNKIAE